jgi:NADH-quinone oxidoreductase subunit M
VTLSSVGLPGTNGFVGEFLILVGAFESSLRWWAVIASSGVIFAAVYMLWMFQRVMFGELDNPKNQVLEDLNLREIAIMVPLIVLIFVMGVYPNPFIEKMTPSVKKVIAKARIEPVATAKVEAPVAVQPEAAPVQPAADKPAGH